MRRLLSDSALFLLFFGAPCYFWLSYTGPYAWVAEAQLAMFGSYMEIVAVFGAIAIWLGFVFLVAALVSRFLPLPLGRWWSYVRHGEGGTYRIVHALFLVAPLICALAGVYLRHLASVYREPVAVSLDSLAKGNRCPSRFIELTDALPSSRNARTLQESENGTVKNTTTYVPVFTHDYRAGDPVHAFIELLERDRHNDVDGDHAPRGLVAFGGLPGLIRNGFVRGGMAPAANYVLLRYHTTGDTYRSDGNIAFILAGVFAGMGMFTAIRGWFARRKAAKAAPPAGPPANPYMLSK